MDPDSRRSPRARRSGARGRSAGDLLRVTVSDGRGRPVRDGGLARWLTRVAPSRVWGEVAVALVTDAHIKKLNSQYRRTNATTDVLSFPSTSAPRIPDRGSRTGGAGSRIPDPESRLRSPLLGDVVIATRTARRQARETGHSYQAELRVLALHGLLHLLGYDHESAADAGRMARLEARLRRKGGLRAGLIERS